MAEPEPKKKPRFRGRPAKRAPKRRSPDDPKSAAQRKRRREERQEQATVVVRSISRSVSYGERELILRARQKGHQAISRVVAFWISLLHDENAPLAMRNKAAENLGDRCGLPRRSKHDVESANTSLEITGEQIARMLKDAREQAGVTNEEALETLNLLSAEREEERFQALIAPLEIPEGTPIRKQHAIAMRYLQTMLGLPQGASVEDIRLSIIEADHAKDLRAETMHEIFLGFQDRLARAVREERDPLRLAPVPEDFSSRGD